MAIVRKYLANENYAKMDNTIPFIDKKELSDGAYRLYGALASFSNGRTINDNYILKAFGISSNSLKKYKKQLSDLDLIYVDRLGAKNYIMYIGSSQIGASKVKEYWEELEKEQKPITRKELYELRKKYNK